MLKNVHLAPQWLVQMEKRLHSLTPHSNFRLFLTMEINPRVGASEYSVYSWHLVYLTVPYTYVQVPVNLLRASRIITFEPPPGVKANLLRTFSAVSSTRMSKVHYVHTCAVCRGHTPTWSSFLCRSLPNVLACTSSWLGSMPWSKRGFTTVHWAGPRNTSLMSQTSGWPVTHWTLGWIWCLRLVTCAGS